MHRPHLVRDYRDDAVAGDRRRLRRVYRLTAFVLAAVAVATAVQVIVAVTGAVPG